MIIEMLLIWIVLFVVFIVINIVERSHNFGAIAGIWLLLLGCFIIVNGIQAQTGVQVIEDETGIETTFLYTDITLPFSTYAFIWGIIFILVGIYIVYANLLS